MAISTAAGPRRSGRGAAQDRRLHTKPEPHGIASADLGFDVVVWSKTKITLLAPTGISLDNSITMQLGVYLQAVAGAKAHHVQSSADGGKTWLDVGIWPNTKGIVIQNLTPGTIYTVRIRAIGGSTQYGPWSPSISLMAT